MILKCLDSPKWILFPDGVGELVLYLYYDSNYSKTVRLCVSMYYNGSLLTVLLPFLVLLVFFHGKMSLMRWILYTIFGHFLLALRNICHTQCLVIFNVL